MNALPPLTRSDRAATLVIALTLLPAHGVPSRWRPSTTLGRPIPRRRLAQRRLSAARRPETCAPAEGKKNTYGGRLISSRRLSPGGGCARSLEPIAPGDVRPGAAPARRRPGNALTFHVGHVPSVHPVGAGSPARSDTSRTRVDRGHGGTARYRPSGVAPLAQGRRAAQAFPAGRPTRPSHSARPRQPARRVTRPGPGRPTSLIEGAGGTAS